jgi:hypothetical protein
MTKYGPSRGDHWFRVVASILGLAFMTYGMVLHDTPLWGWLDVGILGGGFLMWLGGSSAWALWRGR